jgi:UDP-glucose 4-epimerase
MKKNKILITGGAGYIGSHICVELLSLGYDLLVLDNLNNSTINSLDAVKLITGKDILFIKGDVRDHKLLNKLFSQYIIISVIHLAGLKSVGESVQDPLEYYDNNVLGSQVLFQAMTNAGVYNLVFSSSATVYGEPYQMPISEDCPTGYPANPYGRTKLIVEHMLNDVVDSDSSWNIALLRYFNPVGAHHSGLIGEDPSGVPNNLLPFICQVAVGKLNKLTIFGNDYNTKDGTGVRDYIHVVDLAKGHIAALDFINNSNGIHVWNLGTGSGYSVLDVVHEFEKINKVKIPFSFCKKRDGDVAICYADPTKAKRELLWEAKLGLNDMVKSAWRWQSMNPHGYKAIL